MKGWGMTALDGFQADDQLKAWLNKAEDFVKNLPAK
jgi:hypothetical protein